jgi:phosphatidylinositol alpha-1,6-mannosyltransferase
MARRPRILMAAASLRPGAGGIARVARLMARVLDEQRSAGRLEVAGLSLQRLPSGAEGWPRWLSTRGSQPAMALAVQATAAWADACVYDFSGIARAHPRLPGLARPYLTWLHGVEVWEDARADRVARARVADLLLVNSEYTRQRAARLHPGLERAQVCWLATEEDDAPELTPVDGPPTVLMLGRMSAGEAYKGHAEVIECWPRVLSAVPDARLVIVGEGDQRPALQEAVRVAGLGASVRFAGFVPDAQLPALWQQATAFCMPSRGEGFGLAYVEAMRWGLPVVASIHDAAPEVNLDGQTGFNVDLGRRGSLEERLIMLLRDRDAAAAMGRAGQARWRTHFRLGVFRERFLPHLERLIRAGRRPL